MELIVTLTRRNDMVYIILYSLITCGIVSGNSFYYFISTHAHANRNQYEVVPISGKYGYIIFTAKGSIALYVDLATESGNPYYRAIFSNRNVLSLFAWNTSESDVGSGFAQHGDGGPILSRDHNRDFWIRWSPYELSVGRGLTVDSGLIESETHPAPVVQNYNLRIFVINNDYMRITINYETPLLSECLRDNVTCDAGKECVDYVGGYSCECPAWKIGNDCSQDAAAKSGVFQTTREEMVPVFTPYKTLEVLTSGRCAIWCQQEAECETFAVKPISTGGLLCLLYDGRPLSLDYRPEAGAITMEITKTVYN